MINKIPRVSVLTPIYNTNPVHLRECIESILNQTFVDFEFLILNDSPDNKEIEDIILDYAKHDNRVKYYKNEHNIGISESRNKLLDLATAEYIAIFDHDDISVSTRLEQSVEFLDENPDVGVVCGNAEYFGDENYIYTTPTQDIDIKILLTHKSCITHGTAMIRKSVLVKNNIKYEKYYFPSEDYRLWHKLMQYTNFYNIPNVLIKYRVHNNRTSVVQEQKKFITKKSIMLQMRNQYPEYNRAFYRLDNANMTIFRLRLFGFIPFIKIKNNRVLLFDFITIFKIKWE